MASFVTLCIEHSWYLPNFLLLVLSVSSRTAHKNQIVVMIEHTGRVKADSLRDWLQAIRIFWWYLLSSVSHDKITSFVAEFVLFQVFSFKKVI